MCFSVGSPLQRHLPTTKWAVHPNSYSSAKLRNPETITKTNRKNISSHQNSFERYDNTSRRLAPKTRLLSRKNRDLLNKTPLLYSPTSQPTSLPTHPRPLLPLYARLRALSEISFFAFTLHRPPYLSHYWRIRGEGKFSESLHPMQRKKSYQENRMIPTSQRMNLRRHVPSPLPSPSTSCISNQCRAPTLFFEVKEIGRAFTLFVHLSH